MIAPAAASVAHLQQTLASTNSDPHALQLARALELGPINL